MTRTAKTKATTTAASSSNNNYNRNNNMIHSTLGSAEPDWRKIALELSVLFQRNNISCSSKFVGVKTHTSN